MTSSFTATVTGGTRLLIELINQTSTSAILSAIEITAANPAGVANPTVNVELSTNGGATWTPLATQVAMDRFGRGSALWTPATQSSEVVIRTTATNAPEGDYDRNAQVDGGDFLLWQRTLGAAVVTPGLNADGNQNGVIDGSDLNVWSSRFGSSGSGAPLAQDVSDRPFLVANNGTSYYVNDGSLTEDEFDDGRREQRQ